MNANKYLLTKVSISIMSNAIGQELSVFTEYLKEKTEHYAGYYYNLTCNYTLLSKFLTIY